MAPLPQIPRRPEAGHGRRSCSQTLPLGSLGRPEGQRRRIDHKAQTGDDLRDFVNGKLFPYLHSFKQKATGLNAIEYKIGEIKNKIHSGYLREIMDEIAALDAENTEVLQTIRGLP